jgi:hypothetical protein
MRRKFVHKGRHTLLPILGDALIEVCIRADNHLVLAFKSADKRESELRIEDRITLRRGETLTVLEGSKPGSTFDPRKLSPILDLLGRTVTESIAEENGSLRIGFANNVVLNIASTTGYEAWHFQYPRPSREFLCDSDEPISLTGADGHLI